MATILQMTLVQIMAWHQVGNKPLAEQMKAKVTDAYMHHPALLS